MAISQYQFEFETYEHENELTESDRTLLQMAKEHTASAYAPYSRFLVAAVARTVNGKIVRGTNQENASYPVGICAERVLLSTLSSICPFEPVDTIAISYNNLDGTSTSPASPCGLCRQSLLEYEQRMHNPIRMVLAGLTGKIIVVKSAKDLLPFSFSAEDLH